jgi:hypothetical protein
MSQQAIKRRIPWPVPAVGVLIVAAQTVWVLASLFLAGMSCDESCDPTSGLWRDNPDAWQWSLLWIISGIGLLCAMAAVVFAARDQVRATSVSFGLSAIAVVAWVAFFMG